MTKFIKKLNTTFLELLKNFNNQYINTIILEGENHFFADGESYEMHNEAKQKIVDWILKQ